MEIKTTIIVSGIVQGVGFRFYTYSKAVKYNLKGYVRNLYTGEVEIEVEGEENIINSFIDEIKIGPKYSTVKNLAINRSKCKFEYFDFQVRN